MEPKPLVLTMGDPGGIGPEITAKAWQELRGTGPVFFLVGDAKLAEQFGPVHVITNSDQAATVFADALPVVDLGTAGVVQQGQARAQTASAVIGSIEQAVQLALSGKVAGIVTNPIHKAALQDSGFTFPGHTEFLGNLTLSAPYPEAVRGPVMMLAAPELRTVPVTIHQSVIAAATTLTTDAIVQTARVTHHALRHDFGIDKPRLAISGLNPHAGEDGRMGTEDIDVIMPAINAMCEEGINAHGPIPADAMFHERAREGYDAAICMLHDQALIPVKTLAFDTAVNVTIGLPIVRTSPDHGTALDIAGKGIARADSLIAAIRLAADIARQRQP